MLKCNKKGLTLIEVLLSFAILAILSVALLPLFSAAFRGIISAGAKSDTIYHTQDEAEVKIQMGAESTANIMTIVFPGASPKTIVMNGEDVTNGDVNVFIPE